MLAVPIQWWGSEVRAWRDPFWVGALGQAYISGIHEVMADGGCQAFPGSAVLIDYLKMKVLSPISEQFKI
jgi:hypothetical protein